MNTEEAMRAACMMRDAAEKMAQSATRIEEAVQQFQRLLDPGWGGVAPGLLEELRELRSIREGAAP